ncbi:MAG: hypothetical protein WC350_04890 [Candidatus Micrarchaeia archaeon]|jgi:hypothetical protein
MTTTALGRKIKELLITMRDIVEKKIANKEIKYFYENYYAYCVDDFEYNIGGRASYDRTGKKIKKKQWKFSHTDLFGIIRKSEIYNDVLTMSGINKTKLDAMMMKIIYFHLYGNGLNDKNIKNTVNQIVKYINDEPVKCRCSTYLQGITLESDSFNIKPGITLRRTKKEDFEEQMPEELQQDLYACGVLLWSPSLEDATAIIDLTALVRPSQTDASLQKEAYKIIDILRLFRIGSISHIKTSFRRDYIIPNLGGGTLSSSVMPPSKICTLATSDEKRFKKFFMHFYRKMPYDGFKISSKEHIQIAYSRYLDGLLPGYYEKRMADMMAGLEALLLSPGEQQEIAFRLRLRASKIMHCIGFDASTVKKDINEAYSIRSIFAHGGRISQKHMQELDKKYKDKGKNLFDEIANYLRIILVLSIIIDKNKTDFVKMIDDSFIEEKNKNELRKNILSNKTYLPIQ